MLLHFLIRILEMAFCIGIVGSLTVAILTCASDIPEFLRKH